MKRLFKILRIVVSLGLIAILLYSIREELHQILATLKNTIISLYFLCFFLNLLITLIISHRLREIFRVMGIHFTFWNCTVLNFIGLFFNNFLPTSAGGDILKIYYASQGSGKKLESMAGVLVDRLLGLFGIFLLAAIAILLVRDIKNAKILTILIWGILGVFILILFLGLNHYSSSKIKKSMKRIFNGKGKIKNFIGNTFQIIEGVMQAKTTVAYVLSLSLLIQFLSIGIMFLLTQSLSLNVAFRVLIVVVPIIFVVSLFPSINGLGIREGAYVYFLGGIVGTGKAFALSLLFLSITLFFSLIGGFFYIWVNKTNYFERNYLYRNGFLK